MCWIGGGIMGDPSKFHFTDCVDRPNFVPMLVAQKYQCAPHHHPLK
jgi:hypothetical protein